MTAVSTKPKPMYVGYLPMPGRHRAAVFSSIAVLGLGGLGVAGVFAASQRDPGDGVWDIAAERTWSGSIVLEPYPMLVEPDGTGWFIVGIGKFGVHDRLGDIGAGPAEVRGYALQREQRRMIELGPGADAVRRIDDSSVSAAAEVVAAKPVELFGEIVDGKCYLGAMKPGDGKAHKACATLCIEGGLPALFAGAGDGLLPLLRVDGSADLPPEVLAMVGEPVRLTGTLGEINGLPVLDVAACDISRAP